MFNFGEYAEICHLPLTSFSLTEIPWFDFLSYGAPSTRALRARVELRYNLNQTINLYSKIQLTLEHIYVTFQWKAKWF